MKIAGYEIGVCSWSISRDSTTNAIARARKLGFGHMQLALYPMMFHDESELVKIRTAVARSQLIFTAGMISFPGEDYSTIDSIRKTGGVLPDEDWNLRRSLVHHAASLGSDLGLTKISMHAGFIPSHRDETYAKVAMRMRELALMMADYRMELLLETGQEYADTLSQFLDALAMPNLGVNFDPANMILYGAGDPFEAIEILGKRIRHVHIKDATSSDSPGEKWGREVTFGTGEVDPKLLIETLKGIEYDGYLCIEREGGADWKIDVPAAVEALKRAE